MASIRKLKKDLSYIVRDFVEDTYFLMELYPEKAQDLETITDQLYEEYEKFISFLHHPPMKMKKHAFGKDPVKKLQRNKEHAKKIKQATDEFLQRVNAFYEKIDEIIGSPEVSETSKA